MRGYVVLLPISVRTRKHLRQRAVAAVAVFFVVVLCNVAKMTRIRISANV